MVMVSSCWWGPTVKKHPTEDKNIFDLFRKIRNISIKGGVARFVSLTAGFPPPGLLTVSGSTLNALFC